MDGEDVEGGSVVPAQAPVTLWQRVEALEAEVAALRSAANQPAPAIESAPLVDLSPIESRLSALEKVAAEVGAP